MARVILVVDDDGDVREALCEALADLGHQALQAADGTEALGTLREGVRPDLILLDINMAGLDGRGFHAALAADPALAAIPVAFLTASRPRPDSLPAGVPVVTKPIRMDDLVALVARHVTYR
jgi:CheY-like chemotaxis protein